MQFIRPLLPLFLQLHLPSKLALAIFSHAGHGLNNLSWSPLQMGSSTFTRFQNFIESKICIIARYGQPRSGPDRYRPGPTDLRPSRIEPILLVRSGPSVSPGPIGSVHLNCLDRSVRSKCKLEPKTDRSGPICKSYI